jgi:hypothetical protein
MAETLDERQKREEAESLKAIEERDKETEARLGKDEYVVAAPLIYIKVKDGQGGVVVRTLNGGGRFKAEDVDEDNLRHLVTDRLVVPVDHPDAAFAVPAGTPMPAEPPNVPVTEGAQVRNLDTESRVSANREAADAAAKRSPAKPGPTGSAKA